LAVYFTHNAQRQRQTDRQTDDSIMPTVQSAKNRPQARTQNVENAQLDIKKSNGVITVTVITVH